MRKENGVYHKSLYCSDFVNCSDGEGIFEIFLLSDVQYHSNDRGIRWLNLYLEDRTGRIKAKVWSENLKMEYEGLEGQVVFVKGKIVFYAGRPDLNVEEMWIVREGEFELLEVCRGLEPEKEQACKSQLSKMIEKITAPDIKEYCSSIMDDVMVDRMARLPVHLIGHHTYRGALLKHTCDVATGAYYHVWSTNSLRLQECDLSLVIAGALLHDIGSAWQLEPEGYGFQMQSTKRLQGSVYAAHMILMEAARKCQLDDETFSILLNIVDSSHENGSEPVCMEAMAVRSANLLSIDAARYEDSFRDYDLIYGGEAKCIWSRNLKKDIYRRRKGGI